MCFGAGGERWVVGRLPRAVLLQLVLLGRLTIFFFVSLGLQSAPFFPAPPKAQAVASVLREQVRGGMGKLQTYWQQRVVGHAERIVELEQGLAMERAKVEEERARQAAQPIRSSVPVTQTSSQVNVWGPEAGTFQIAAPLPSLYALPPCLLACSFFPWTKAEVI